MTVPELFAVKRPFLTKCQEGLFLWPTVKELIWFTISLPTFNFRLINSCCSAAGDRARNSSEKISYSTVGTGRSPSCLGSGLNSQHRPVNFSYARRAEYSASRSPWFGCQSKVVQLSWLCWRKHFSNRFPRNIRCIPFFPWTLNISPTQVINSVDEQSCSMATPSHSLDLIALFCSRYI